MSDKQAVSIRFPLSMYRKIHELAEKSHRSFNGQVVHLLSDGLKRMEKIDAENELLAQEAIRKINEATGVPGR